MRVRGRGRGDAGVAHAVSEVGGENSGNGGKARRRKGRGRKKDGKNVRCYLCNRLGHVRDDCTLKEEDYLQPCKICSGYVHKEKLHDVSYIHHLRRRAGRKCRRTWLSYHERIW